jgi:hypothetical protein
LLSFAARVASGAATLRATPIARVNSLALASALTATCRRRAAASSLVVGSFGCELEQVVDATEESPADDVQRLEAVWMILTTSVARVEVVDR